MKITNKIEVNFNEEEIETINKAQEIFAILANALDDNDKEFSDLDVTYKNFITDGCIEEISLRENLKRALRGLTYLTTHMVK